MGFDSYDPYDGLYIAIQWVLFLVILWVSRRCLIVVRHAEVMIVERFGRYSCTLTPGIHWLWPILDIPRKVHWKYMDTVNGNMRAIICETDRIDMREHILDFGKQNVITKDTVSIVLDALVYFRITDPRIAVFKAQNLPDMIELLTQATLRNIIAKMTLDDTFSNRDHVNAELLSVLRPDAERWGVTITRVEISEIDPPYNIKLSMENQIKAERERRSHVLIADGKKESMIVMSRGTAASIVLNAEGQRSVDLLKAKGDAQAKMLLAQAESKSIEYMQVACERLGVRAVDYLMAVQYLNSLLYANNSSASSSQVVLIPTKTIVGISEIINLTSGGLGKK